MPSPLGQLVIRAVRAINFIVGPLGSGETRLAQRLAQELPGAAFLGRDQFTESWDATRARMAADPALEARVEAAQAWLLDDGASPSDALLALLVGVEDNTGALVVDMIEHGLEEATQVAVIA